MSLMGRLRALVAQLGLFVLLLGGAILVVGAAILWGLLAGTIAVLVGLQDEAILFALVGGILGVFPTVKATLWVRMRLGRPPEKPLDDLTEVFD
jgi:hypothetical protein